MAQIKIPSQLRAYAGNQESVDVEAGSVKDALDALIAKYPTMKDRLFDENDAIRRFVNIFLGDEDVRFMENLETKLEANSELSIVPAIAGGC